MRIEVGRQVNVIGDIIISARGTVGALAVLKKKMAFNQSCYGVRNKDSNSDNAGKRRIKDEKNSECKSGIS